MLSLEEACGHPLGIDEMLPFAPLGKCKFALEDPTSREGQEIFKKNVRLETAAQPLHTPPAEEVIERCLNVDSSHIESIASLQPLHRPVVAVLGVGYVGSNLVRSFAQHYNVIAFEVSETRLSEIQLEFLSHPSVTCTKNPSKLSDATHFLVCVPTSLKEDKSLDISCLNDAVRLLSKYAQSGATIVVESSVSVGMTRDLFRELMVKKGFKVGMSPERVDPGRISPSFTQIPKIISGLDDLVPGSLESVHELYGKVFETIVRVSCPEVAEMTKLYENCQRMIGIAYANEMADACRAIGISHQEVCDAAATKPFGYTPFKPSLGVGGSCIPVNPYYLFAASGLTAHQHFPLLRKATVATSTRPQDTADNLMTNLTKATAVRNTSLGRRHRVLIVGMGFKKGQGALNGSPSVAFAKHLLKTWDAYVEFADPLVPSGASDVPKLNESRDWTREHLKTFDLIVVAFCQIGLNLELLEDLGQNTKVEWFGQ